MTNIGRRAVLVLTITASVSAAQAAGPAKDPNWPCQQAKVVAFPLASVWEGPPPESASGGREDPQVADLAGRMSQRRVSVDEVKTAVEAYSASGAPKGKLLQAFLVAFDDLVRQRSEIIAGLDKFGRQQREMAERIRAENETAHKGAEPDAQALQKLEWDLRVFDERRRTASYVCEAPQAIETRIGEMVKLVRGAL